jgi:hypothetical protein
MQQQGVYKPRKSFPQLPGAVVENPTYIETKHGNKLLTSGWWAWARKPVSVDAMDLLLAVSDLEHYVSPLCLPAELHCRYAFTTRDYRGDPSLTSAF